MHYKLSNMTTSTQLLTGHQVQSTLQRCKNSSQQNNSWTTEKTRPFKELKCNNTQHTSYETSQLQASLVSSCSPRATLTRATLEGRLRWYYKILKRLQQPSLFTVSIKSYKLEPQSFYSIPRAATPRGIINCIRWQQPIKWHYDTFWACAEATPCLENCATGSERPVSLTMNSVRQEASPCKLRQTCMNTTCINYGSPLFPTIPVSRQMGNAFVRQYCLCVTLSPVDKPI